MREPVEIVDYDPKWPSRFLVIADKISSALGDQGVQVDHIGSTSVPGLAAKDRIDIQITIPTDDPDYISIISKKLVEHGFNEPLSLYDHKPPGDDSTPEQWQKFYIRGDNLAFKSNIHVRVAGRKNQIYPLLFRDYLRANQNAALAYGLFKRRLAKVLRDDRDTYCDVKDPVCDILMENARSWAKTTGWQPR